MSTTLPPIVLATHNRDKVREFQEMLGDRYQMVTMSDVGFTGDIAETAETFIGNARLKAQAVHDFLQQRGRHFIVVAEDSGLCVDVLGGRPGVYTARYGGEGCDEHMQRMKLLEELEGKSNREARFVCTLVCIADDLGAEMPVEFVGHTFGEIATEELGENGFAFDQIFLSRDLGKTFAEATDEEKASVSHRGRAVAQLREYLEQALDLD